MSTLFTLGLQESIDDSASSSSLDVYNRVGHNSGNLAFHYATNRLIRSVPPVIPWSSTAAEINAMGDLGILPCANQLGSHTDMTGLGETLRGVTTNLVAVGLGAQGGVGLDDIPHVPAGTLDWIEQIAARASSTSPNITVRGDYTLRVLEHYGFGGRAVSLGCPSLMINTRPDLGRNLERRYRAPFGKIAIAAGHPDWIEMSALESSLVKIMQSAQGAYIVQNTYDSIALSRGDLSVVSDEYKNKLKGYLGLDMDLPEFEKWVRGYMISFYNIPAWMEYLRRFDFVVGSRIHGVMLAMQAGVPGLCIAHDSRIREMCEKSRIPFVMAHQVYSGVTLSELRDMINFDGAEYDKNRLKISEMYKDFFRSNGVQ